MPPSVRIYRVSPNTGNREERDVTTDGLGNALASGWKVEGDEAGTDRAYHEGRLDTVRSTGEQAWTAFSEGLDALSFGGFNAARVGVGGDEARERIALGRENNPDLVTGARLAATAAPIIASGGAGAAGAVARATPVGAASRLGTALSRAGDGASLATRVGRGAGGAAAESTAYAVADTAADLALDDDPVTFDRIMGSLSTKLLTTGGLSALGGGAVGGLEHALVAGRRQIRAAKAAEEAATVAPIPDDLAALDRKGLRAAEEAELATIEAARVPQRQVLAEEINSYRELTKDPGSAIGEPWVAVATGSKDAKATAQKLAKRARTAAEKAEAAAAEAAKEAAADAAVAGAGVSTKTARLDDLRKNVADLEAGALRAAPDKRQNLLDLAATRKGEADRLADEIAALSKPASGGKLKAVADQLAEEAAAAATAAEEAAQLAATKYPRWMREQQKLYMEGDKYLDRVLRNPKALADNPRLAKAALQQQENALELIAAKGEELRVFHALDKTGRRSAALTRVPEALAANRALQRQIDTIVAAPASDRLTAIRDAIEAGPAKMSMRQKVGAGLAFGAVMGAASGVDVPGMGYLAPVLAAGAGAAVAGKLGGTVAKVAKVSRDRQIKAVDTFLAGSRVARKAVPPLASRILAEARFGPDEEKRAPSERPRTKALTLADLYEKRSGELAAAIMPGPDGKATVRPHVRQQIAAHLQPIAVTAPHLADRLESRGVARLVFLYSKMPRTTQIGMTRIPPDDFAIRAWARYMAAADDPGGVEERLADGTVTREDRETMQALYPDRYAEIVRMIVERLPTLRGTLPYQQRLVLSQFTGAPVEAALDPRILAQLQGMYAKEPGTEGGTRAPVPKPTMGSISRPEGTPAQQRAG